jgi:hypothetical protein
MTQRQAGDKESANLQAGRDMTIYQGPSIEEVRGIALDVFRSNFLDLRGIAETVARDRAEQITEQFLEKMERASPNGVPAGADPDFQNSLFNAQREFACSGEADLAEVLVDLLVDRAGHTDRGLQTIVLNEAIVAVPKLSAGQRRALGLAFLIRHTSTAVRTLSVDQFYESYVSQLAAVGRDLPTDSLSFQHIEYVGAGSVTVATLSIPGALAQTATGWFTRGFTEEEVPEELRQFLGDDRFFKPCLRDGSRFQLTRMLKTDKLGEAEEALDEAQATALAALLGKGAMDEAEIRGELVTRSPQMADVLEAWEGSDLKSMQLTSVGMAIGHGYWRRVSDSSTPLDIWIPNK